MMVQFHVFPTVWKFAEAIGSPEVDLLLMAATVLATMTEE